MSNVYMDDDAQHLQTPYRYVQVIFPHKDRENKLLQITFIDILTVLT